MENTFYRLPHQSSAVVIAQTNNQHSYKFKHSKGLNEVYLIQKSMLLIPSQLYASSSSSTKTYSNNAQAVNSSITEHIDIEFSTQEKKNTQALFNIFYTCRMPRHTTEIMSSPFVTAEKKK